MTVFGHTRLGNRVFAGMGTMPVSTAYLQGGLYANSAAKMYHLAAAPQMLVKYMKDHWWQQHVRYYTNSCSKQSSKQACKSAASKPAARVCRLLLGGLFRDHVCHKTVGPSLAIRLIQSIRLHHCHLCIHQHISNTTLQFLPALLTHLRL